jgi:hypothetical protein
VKLWKQNSSPSISNRYSYRVRLEYTPVPPHRQQRLPYSFPVPSHPQHSLSSSRLTRHSTMYGRANRMNRSLTR